MTTTSQPQAAPSIRETVEQTVSPQYLSYGGQAITALEQREQQIVMGLTDHLTSVCNLSQQQVQAALASVGLASQSSSMGGDGTIEQVLREVRALSQRLDSASQQASRHGIRF